MANTKVHIKAVDSNGKTLIDKDIVTMKNGFFELWLPRKQQINLTISGFGKKATGMVETFDKSKTCVTTFHLK